MTQILNIYEEKVLKITCYLGTTAQKKFSYLKVWQLDGNKGQFLTKASSVM